MERGYGSGWMECNGLDNQTVEGLYVTGLREMPVFQLEEKPVCF